MPKGNPKAILNRIYRGSVLAFDNAVRLHNDSIFLYDNNRIPSALYTSILSMEEIGKYFMWEDFCWQSACKDDRPSLKLIEQSLIHSYSHRSKQGWFATHAELPQKLYQLLFDGKLEERKQKSVYVGFFRNKKKIDFSKRISTPASTSRKRASEYITTVNDFLIGLSVGIRMEVYELDIEEVNGRLRDETFEKQLRKMWPIMRSPTKKLINRCLKANV